MTFEIELATKEKLDEVQANFRELSTKVDSIDIASVESEVETLSTDVESLQTSVAEISTIKTNTTKLQGKVDTVENKVKSIETNITGLQGKVTVVENEIKGVKTNVTSLQEKMTTAESQIETIETNVTSLQGKIDTTENEIKSIKTDVTGLKSKITAVDEISTIKTNVSTAMEKAEKAFQQANDIKKNWASVIGSPLSSSDTSAQLKSKTQTIKNSLASSLSAKGVSSNGSQSLSSLVSSVARIQTGKRFKSGEMFSTNTVEMMPGMSLPAGVEIDIPFSPSIVIVQERSSDGCSSNCEIIYVTSEHLPVMITLYNSNGNYMPSMARWDSGVFKAQVANLGVKYYWLAYE